MFHIFPTPAALAQQLGQELAALIRQRPQAVLGLATGSTMEPVYAQLLQQVRAQALDVSGLSTFNLDEYIGLPASHPHSYHYYMRQHLFNALGLRDEQVHLPNGMHPDIAQECAQYSARIAQAGGLDFQLLGIGTNGHIGFNEPGTPFDSLTHAIALTENTRSDNSRLFDNPAEMPTHAITMGIQDILGAKDIVLVATGAHKAQVMQQLYHSAPHPQMPASALKTHARIRIYVDAEAAALLPPTVQQRVG